MSIAIIAYINSGVYVDPFWTGFCALLPSMLLYVLGSTTFQSWCVMKLVPQVIIWGYCLFVLVGATRANSETNLYGVVDGWDPGSSWLVMVCVAVGS